MAAIYASLINRGVGRGIAITARLVRKLIVRIFIVGVRRDGYSASEEVSGLVMEGEAGGGNVWVISDFWIQKLQVFVELGTNCLI